MSNAPWLTPSDENYMKAFTAARAEQSGAPAPAPEEDARLAVDIFETPTEIVAKAPIAGVRAEHLDISLSHDMLTIRGKRADEPESGRSYLNRECHWGAFSRTVILPVSVSFERSRATFEQGVLTIRMPKLSRDSSIPINDVSDHGAAPVFHA